MNISDFATIGWDLFRLVRSSRWDQTRIRDYQATALVRIMRHAVTHVPFYRATGIEAETINSPQDLERFPIITKSTIREFNADLVADYMDRATLDKSVTSGSTGEPTTTFFDRSTWLHDKYASKIHRMVANGVGLFGRVIIASEYSPASLGGTTAQYLPGAGLLFKQRRVSVHESPAKHVDVFREFRPHALYTFPSYVAELIAWCEAHSIQLPPLKVVFTSSEVLTADLRKRISAFFHAPVCDIYGSTEFKEVAWECSHGRLHLNFESTYVESIAEDHDDFESLLLTTMRNRAMPLLRYRIGDFGKVRIEPCECGRESPWLDAIAGREVDVLELPSGRRVSPYVLITHSIDHTPEILRYQFVQTAPERLEIHVKLARNGRKINELQYIAQEVATRLGGEMHVALLDVEHIPRTSGGKQHVLIRAADAGQ